MPPPRFINGREGFLYKGQWIPVFAGGDGTDDDETDDEDTNDDTEDEDGDDDGENDDTEDEDDEKLGDAGKKALAKERKARKAAEKRAKAAEREKKALQQRLQKAEKGDGKPKDDSANGSDSEEAAEEAREQERARMHRRIIKVELKALAVGKLKDPDDIRLIDIDELDVELNDEDELGKAGVAELKSAIDDLIEEKPHLASEAKDAKKPKGDGDGGARGSGKGNGKKKVDPDKRLEKIKASTGIS